jgi:hypothetical protein
MGGEPGPHRDEADGVSRGLKVGGVRHAGEGRRLSR